MTQQALDILTALYACANADSLLGETSLHSDEFFVWEILDSAFKEGMLPETVAASIDDDYPLALPRSRWSTIVSMDEVRSYSDDSVTVLFTREAPGASPPQDARLAYFVMTEDGLKLQKLDKAPLKAGSGPVLDLSLIDIAFAPKELIAPADTDVTIRIVNNGAAQHDFSIESLGIHTGTLNPGEVATVVVNAPAGTYQFICTVPGHKEAGMVGMLTLVEQGATSSESGRSQMDFGSETPAAASNTLEVTANDIFFDPKTLEGPANTDIAITITNKGAATHSFAIPDLGIASEMINPGQSVTVTINAPAGDYQYICIVPGHKEAGMMGTLTLT